MFYSGEDLCLSLKENIYFDIIFLDIELKLMTGIDVGKRIREVFLNETTQLIYISGKESYAMELFQVRPLYFLIKPITYKKIETVLLTAFRLIQKGNQVFEYQSSHITSKVQIKNILYFESCNRKVNIVTENNQDCFYDTLNNVSEILKKFNFLLIHKSYLVNYNHVIKFEYHQVTMINNIILPISQPKRKGIRELHFLLEENRREGMIEE